MPLSNSRVLNYGTAVTSVFLIRRHAGMRWLPWKLRFASKGRPCMLSSRRVTGCSARHRSKCRNCGQHARCVSAWTVQDMRCFTAEHAWKLDSRQSSVQAAKRQLQAAQQQVSAGLEREMALHAMHTDAHHSLESRDAVIDTHAAELARLQLLVLQADVSLSGVGQELQSCWAALDEMLQSWR